MMVRSKESAFTFKKRNKRDEEGAPRKKLSSWKVTEVVKHQKDILPELPEHTPTNAMALEDLENHDPIRSHRRQHSSPRIDSIAIKTPLKSNISAKHTSNHQTSRTVLSELCYNDKYNAHLISGPRGVGKTYVAHIAAQLPLAKKIFTDGIVWIGLGSRRPLRFEDLVQLYDQICEEVNIDVKKRYNFDDILFVPSVTEIVGEEEKLEEKGAMMKARNKMSKRICAKNCLIILDGLFDANDIEFFQFFTESPLKTKCRALVTAESASLKMNKSGVKLWQLTSMNTNAAKDLFLNQLSKESTKHPEFKFILRDSHKMCRGNPLSITTLCKMIDDKTESDDIGRLRDFVWKFETTPVDPKMQIFAILEAILSRSSLGEEYGKVAWRCFAAFCTVFTRDSCFRPFVPRSPIRALFCTVVERIGKTSMDSMMETADKVIDFLAKVGILTFIDGFDWDKSPRQFFQVSCDIYQEFGEQLIANKETERKLNEMFINEYTSMFTGINAAFGSNEIDYYMLKNLPHHSMKANELEDAALTLQDIRFIEERTKHMGIHSGYRKHIDDTEAMAELVRVADKNMANLILGTSYQACTRVLLAHLSDMKLKAQSEESIVLHAMWMLAFSLLKHNLVMDGCKIIQEAMNLESDPKNKVIKLERKLIEDMSAVESDNKNHCGRAVILIGTSMARSGMRKRDAIFLLRSGLETLEESIGSGTLEVARASVYVGKSFYRDFRMYEHALQYFRDALPTLMRELGEQSEELIDAIISIGKSCIHTGDLDTALEILSNILPKLEGTTALDVKIKVGYIHIIKGDHEDAVGVLNEARAETSDQTAIKQIDELIEKSNQQRANRTI